MLSWIREKFGTVVIGGIITFIAFVFVFYGVFSPKSTRGLHEGAVAGTVNGDPISISEFNRELNRRLEFFKNLGGGKISDEQLKSFHIREGVFQELANRKLLLQEAVRQGLVASDEQVREKIQEVPSFQKDGKFDLVSYKRVLEANNYSPASFEKLVREDLSSQKWESYFQSRIHVSEPELKKEFTLSEDKRKLKYVVLSNESAKKQVDVSADEVKKFLSDSTKLNLVKMKFEEAKTTLYKGQTLEIAQNGIARDILASEKREEIQKINSKLADQILPIMTAEKASDAKINALLKGYQVQVKTTDFVTRRGSHFPQLGDAKEIISDAFAVKSPIDLTQGGKAKKYHVAGQTVVAVVIEKKIPEQSQFEPQRMTMIRQAMGRKTRDFYQEWMRQLSAKASIDTNPAVVNAE